MENRFIIFGAILTALALLPGAQAVSPTPDGCYPNFTTAEGCNALRSLTTGGGNTALGWYSLFSTSTSNFNTTGAVCYRTSATINGWGCYNFDGRTLQVNDTAVACGAMPLPAKWSDGYTYFSVTGGTYPWAGIYAW